jgi:hypothetical protein
MKKAGQGAASGPDDLNGCVLWRARTSWRARAAAGVVLTFRPGDSAGAVMAGEICAFGADAVDPRR